MIVLSLIQTSQNRHQELVRFVKSLNSQENIDFKSIQLIFIDQGNNEYIFKSLNSDIEFTYIKYKQCSLSHARNIGLNYVKGEYVGFPDDDCWYESNVVYKIYYQILKGYKGVIARGESEQGIPTNDFPQKSQIIKKYYHCGAISYTLFLKYIRGVKFDENIGVGSPFMLSSGEEIDFLLKTISYVGTNIYYDSSIIIHHPINKVGNFKTSEIKQYQYARGWGYILRKHKYPFNILLKSFMRPLLGIFFYCIKMDFNKAHHSYYLLKGRIEGFIIRIK